VREGYRWPSKHSKADAKYESNETNQLMSRTECSVNPNTSHAHFLEHEVLRNGMTPAMMSAIATEEVAAPAEVAAAVVQSCLALSTVVSWAMRHITSTPTARLN